MKCDLCVRNRVCMCIDIVVVVFVAFVVCCCWSHRSPPNDQIIKFVIDQRFQLHNQWRIERDE